MKKEVIILFLIILSLTSLTLALNIDAPIKKITHHAEQYEVGNINYAQLIVYITSLSQDLAEEMGATQQGHDAVLKAEQLESSLGKPTETIKWVWVENEEKEKKLDKEIPAWRKIIFDGEKIQIWLNAWPNIVIKNGEDFLFYRLHLDIRFKKSEENIEINKKIEEIKSLALKYNEAPNTENLEILAKESVNAEQLFNSHFNQNPGKCEEVVNNIFGSENKRDTQKILAEEIEFYEGDNFESILRLEMCDECEWPWINLNMWFESRGRFEHPKGNDGEDDINFREKFKSFTSQNFKEGTINLIEQTKNKIAEGDYKTALDNIQELRILTEVWNGKASDVWKEIEDDFKINWEFMTEKEREECNKNYCWIKKEQERKEAEKNLRKKNYEERKIFYLDLFSNYKKKEFYYVQDQWEKRLVEEFKEFGKEICNNNLDDNKNEQVDCSDLQCGGKICGYDIIKTEENNQTREEKIELYCIAGTCQAKEKTIKEKTSICGNHICEENEEEVCKEDCTICVEHPPIECTGNVIFSGKDENNCPLKPICLVEKLSCNTNEECINPLCGDTACINGICEVTKLTECKKSECIDGEEKIQNCESGKEIIKEKCIGGLWKETGVECEISASEIKEKIKEVFGEECTIKSDCGNENDVCSNGKCITLPKAIDTKENIENKEEIKQTEESKENTEQPEQSSEQQTTGNIIFSFFRTLTSKIKISGFAVEEENNSENNNEESIDDNISTEINKITNNEITEQNKEIIENNLNKEFEERDREKEDNIRREAECNERCERECYDREIKPCTEDCIWKECGNELECNIDETKIKCENKCETEKNLENCKSECSNKCLAGEETWVEQERKEHKEEKFVFTVGGSCREAQGKTEGFIWFGGWGENFNDFHLIKNKYHSNGGDWCEEDLENLIKQRKELEKSLNEEFAHWFFEKYVTNSADDWEKHISGIFELYWRDVDTSRQITERLQCLKKDELPPHNLINFKYDTDFGSVEFWEEIKTAKIYEDSNETQIISPYMKTWLFPSREFFKSEMRKSMEKHKLPGNPEEERNTLTKEEKIELIKDDEFTEIIKNFNEKYGENLVVQFKDFNTNEIVFNIHMKINEENIIYFEPMLPSEIPAEDVRIEFDVNKLLNIIEYEERGRVELESPPWDKKPRVGFIKSISDGARMYFMFRGLMNSARTYPNSAEDDTKFLVRNFFEIVMGDENNNEDEVFNEENPESWEEKESLTGEVIKI